MNWINELNSRNKYILNIVQKKGPLTKNQLLDITKMKLSTLNRSIQVLIDKKIIIETAMAESTGGRKPVLIDVNPKDFYLIGIDISRLYIRIVVTNLKMEIITEKYLQGVFDINELCILLPNCIKELLMQFDITYSSFIGVGLGIYKPNDDINLVKENIKKVIDIPIFIENGANAAAMAEHYYGLGKNKENIVYINCGVGIRTGVISSGVLIRTKNGAEDAFGHMTIDIDGDKCWCGNYGCIESYASINKITQKLSAEIKKGKIIHLDKEVDEINYIDVCNLADENNEIAMNIISNAAINFGTGLANYIRLFNPELIILSGPLIIHSTLFYEVCKEVAIKKCHFVNNIDIEFSREGYYHEKSMAVGAASIIIEGILN